MMLAILGLYPHEWMHLFKSLWIKASAVLVHIFGQNLDDQTEEDLRFIYLSATFMLSRELYILGSTVNVRTDSSNVHTVG